jgi:hypothetical protein
MSAASVDELEPQTRLELVIELGFAERELERAGTGFIARGRRARGHGCIADAITLGVVRGRLEAGQTTDELAGLFLAAAHTLVRRAVDELEAGA